MKDMSRTRNYHPQIKKFFFNPNTNSLLFNIAGSHNIGDFAYTDPLLAFGKLKQTNRYKDAKKTLEKAKELYQPKTTTVTCHSLGGSIGSGIASKKDKFLGFNAGYTIGQPTRSKHGMHQQYRTKGDKVSILGSGAKI